ncbi:uncharacterized protein LOC122375491 [Amphibalanus amphitrite]|nr:uncharacterized protein LOC122375491 [Amphibalanus amphitrite]
MEIQDGKGPWASPVTGIVPLGSTLTMVVAINDPNAEFDMRVKECEASDGKGRPIYLSDENGCVLRPKMISKFMKLRSNDGRSTVITYAHFHAFKFPDSMYVHLKCKVEICRYGCPDHCQKAVAGGYAAPSAVSAQYAAPEARGYEEGGLPAASQYSPVVSNSLDEAAPSAEEQAPVVVQAELAEDYDSPSAPVAEQLQQSAPAAAQDLENYSPPPPAADEPVLAVPQPAARPGPKFRAPPRRRRPQQQRRRPGPRRPLHKRVDLARPAGSGQTIRAIPLPLPPRGGVNRQNMPEELPQLPEHLQPVLYAPSTQDVIGKPEAIPVPFETDGRHAASGATGDGEQTSDAGLGGIDRSEFPWGPRQLKIRRKRFVVDEPEAKATDIGVGSLLEVISENDLQFEPTYEDNQRVTIFQGQIRDDIVYGICLPAAGFSALFVLLAMCAVISVLVAGFLCQHRQMQKDSNRQPAAVPLRDWSMVHFLRQRFHPAQ